ncbi:hypothetical protein ARTHRO9AX_220122 [Arthrobacter sp. 9AX]|nr:hypothetical protein ARTHRO9AX_220122 [Arthrobacter sp. 9AX]
MLRNRWQRGLALPGRLRRRLYWCVKTFGLPTFDDPLPVMFADRDDAMGFICPGIACFVSETLILNSVDTLLDVSVVGRLRGPH